MAIGGCTVRELMGRMSAMEFELWKLFVSGKVHGPLGERRADWRAAQICHAVACTVPSSSQPPTTNDFRLDFKPEEEGPETVEEWAALQKKQLEAFCKRW